MQVRERQKFMYGGSELARRLFPTRTAGAAVVLVMLCLQVGPALAQTSDEACAADSLYLISPEAIDLVFETTGKRGLTVSWPNLDLNLATCFSLKDTMGLDFGVSVSGGFGDRVDRVFEFSSPNEGEIGTIQPQNIIVTWRNDGAATYGNIGGKINLSNNGGIWRYNDSEGWSQNNAQLPMSWLQVNTVGLAAGSGGFMVAGFSRGIDTGSNPAGLYTYDGTAWSRIGEEIFDDETLITAIAVSPGSNDQFAVGTDRDGLFVTTDGGLNFTQWTSALDPSYPSLPTNFRAQVVEWMGNRVYVFVHNYGLFISQDNGASFARSYFKVPNDLDTAEPDSVLPVINALSFHPNDPNRIAASLQFHGAYESLDAGESWNNLYGDLVVSQFPPDRRLWENTALDIVYDDVSPQTMVMGVKQKGLYQTTDGGATWVLVGDGVQPVNRGVLLNMSMARLTGRPGTMVVLEDQYSILMSTDSGATWDHFSVQPALDTGLFLLGDQNVNGGLVMGSWGGGVYVPGATLALTDTYSNDTSSELRDLDLGLFITFTNGSYRANDRFELICQTFQGWAVWRGQSILPSEMTLLGLYDRVNPEDCFEGFCGDNNLEPIPNCFAAKRAACFNLDNPDTLRFFDQEVYNGFIYTYAVTSFDYGNTARVTPENNSNEMVYSPRFEGDLVANGGISHFPGPGNQAIIQINEPLAIGADGAYEEIYVFPNPLRSGAGFPRGEGGLVTFTNIPEGAKILVFTTAGDRVIDLGPELILGGNVHWNTQNSSGEPITSGVFLYKVEMAERDDYWGRLVVIR